MPQSTNQLVATAKRFGAAAAFVGVFALGGIAFAGLHSAHAATIKMDDNSIAPLTALDNAMEAVASRVTPAVVNVAVTSKGSSEFATSEGQMQGLPPGLQQFFGPMFQQPAQPQIQHGVGSGMALLHGSTEGRVFPFPIKVMRRFSAAGRSLGVLRPAFD